MRPLSIDQVLHAFAHATEAADLLELAGRLVVLGAPDAIAAGELELELRIGAVEEDAFAILGGIEMGSIEELRARLARRDAIELRLIGAEAILGSGVELEVEEESALIAFEEALRPQLWRLTAFNEWRALEVAWVPPQHRARFWWWSEASEIDPRGALHLDAVAELIARFPEAQARLHQLAATELLLRATRSNHHKHLPRDRSPATEAAAEVVDLSAWIRARTAPLPMAASTGLREQVLFEHPAFTLSLLPPSTLLLDLLERCGPDRPLLRVGARVIEGEPVANALERYRFDLATLGRVTRAELVLSLESGVVRVALPPST
jgi:hypothetical protein